MQLKRYGIMNIVCLKDKKSYSKTKPIKESEFNPIEDWWNNRKESEVCWKVSIDELKTRNFDLDIKNPHKEEEVHEYSSAELMTQLSNSLDKTNLLIEQLKKSDWIMAKIKDLFNLQKGTLQSSKCISGEFDFITASKNWKTHNTYSHECEALIFAAAASGSLGRTHYVNGKFITSDLCFIITPKNEKTYPIDLKFYHIIFNALKDDIVKNTKAGTSKEAIGLKSLGDYDLPYVDIQKTSKKSLKKFNEITKISDNCDSVFIQQLDLIKDLRQAFFA